MVWVSELYRYLRGKALRHLGTQALRHSGNKALGDADIRDWGSLGIVPRKNNSKQIMGSEGIEPQSIGVEPLNFEH